jgi:predicted GNAT family N-acyltransferase
VSPVPPLPPPGYTLEPLSERHDRTAFSCGVPAPDRYLARQAGQDVKRGVSRVYVLAADGEMVAGYFSLSAATIALSDLPPEMARRLPRYPFVPATLVGRLAVASSHRGRALGEFLLLGALLLSWQASRQVASAAVLVDAKDDSARGFCERYGFIRFPDQSNRLFLPMKTVEQLLG